MKRSAYISNYFIKQMETNAYKTEEEKQIQNATVN